MRRLTLVRHAQTVWNAEGRLVGSTDLPLSPAGIWQADRLAVRLLDQHFTAAFSSDRRRAAATASAILVTHPGTPLHCECALRESDFGDAEGVLHATAAIDENSLLDTLAHGLRVWLTGLDAMSSEGHLLVVAHGGSLRVLLCLLLGLPPRRHWSFRLDCASVSVVDCAPGLVTLSLLNDCSHLRKDA